MRTKVIPTTRKRFLQAEVRQHIEPGSEVFTDTLASYERLNAEYVHKVIDHAECYAKGNIHTNGLENFWSLLKRAIKGTYVSVEPFHLFRYLDEQAFRFNERKDNDGGRFVKLAGAIFGRRVTYRELVGAVQATQHLLESIRKGNAGAAIGYNGHMAARTSSHMKPNDEKLRELILHIAKRSEKDACFGAIKLNKLLFFADFLSYLRFGKSITGQEYQRLEQGPAPRRIKPLLNEMQRGKAIAQKSIQFFTREQIRTIPLREPIYGQFTKEELLLVDDLIQGFWNLRADEISELSHGFVGWQVAKNGETIPYKHALLGTRKPTKEEIKYGLSLAS